MKRFLLLACMFFGIIQANKQCYSIKNKQFCQISTANGTCEEKEHVLGGRYWDCTCKAGKKGPNYHVTEKSGYKCENDCDCDGSRTCSEFGFCQGKAR